MSRPAFSRTRSFLWPIHSYEMRKFLPLLLMAFFIGFNYNILRNMKDAILVTAEFSGAEVLPFIKVWGILPGAVLITFLYSRLSNRLSTERVFYAMITLFLSFFAIFTFIIYPLQDALHPHHTADLIQNALPSGLKGLVAMVRYWTFSSFYIMSELWSSAILSMLFWGFANEVTRLGEAKRFYGLIAIGLNVAAIVSGQVSWFLSSNALRGWIVITENPWEQSLILLTIAVLISGVAIMLIYRYLVHKALPPLSASSAPKEEKQRMSMRENFAALLRSKYLLNIAIIVLAYNIIINLTEVVWKDQVKQLYPGAADYNAYMSKITSLTGVVSLFASLLLSGQMIRKLGWTVTALSIPLILLVTSVGFFVALLSSHGLSAAIVSFGTSPLALIVFFGSVQNCVCRSAKFTLFDATKEMAFIPLDIHSKRKGKAAIDGVASRLGKSGGSIIHQILLIIFTTIAGSAHIVALMLFVVIGFWISAVLGLGKEFNALEAKEPLPSPPIPEPQEAALIS